jgi:peptidase YpeB-like protein
MTRHFMLPAALSVLMAGTAFTAQPVLGAKLGTSIESISSALSADGYEMTKFEKEGNRIEVYAVKGSTRHEVYVDATTGEVTKAEARDRRGPTPRPGASDTDIRAALSADGYQITKYERERGQIEVYAMKDGRLWEMKIDPMTGKTLSVEAED